jgi:hypothetical protein
MKYTNEQFILIKKMVDSFKRIHNNEKRRELIWWYSLASGIKNDAIVKRIMIDLKAINNTNNI